MSVKNSTGMKRMPFWLRPFGVSWNVRLWFSQSSRFCDDKAVGPGFWEAGKMQEVTAESQAPGIMSFPAWDPDVRRSIPAGVMRESVCVRTWLEKPWGPGMTPSDKMPTKVWRDLFLIPVTGKERSFVPAAESGAKDCRASWTCFCEGEAARLIGATRRSLRLVWSRRRGMG